MMKLPLALLLALLLVLVGAPLPAQTVFAPRPLAAFRLNELQIHGLPDGRKLSVTVTGSTASGSELLLFRAASIQAAGPLVCYFYLEEEVAEVRVSVAGDGGPEWQGELAVEPELLVVRVFLRAAAAPPPDRRFLLVGSLEDLQPGDVYVSGEGQVPGGLRARGVHVLLTPGAPAGTGEGPPADPLGGRVLGRVDDLGALWPALDGNWEELSGFKQGFLDLVAERRLRSLPTLRGPSADPYEGAVEELAFTLERQAFPARMDVRQSLALLAFYVPALGVVIGVRRPRWISASVGTLLLAFLLYAFLFPGRERSLTLECNPRHLDRPSVAVRRQDAAEPTRLGAALFSREPRRLRFAADDFDAGIWQLRYRAAVAGGGRIPLAPYLEAERVRFNQVPEVTLGPTGYWLEFAGVLRGWSIHEPR